MMELIAQWGDMTILTGILCVLVSIKTELKQALDDVKHHKDLLRDHGERITKLETKVG